MAANLSAEAAAEAAAAAAAAPPEAAARGHNLPALLFGVLLIVVIICGNLLVCLSVFTEKALKTTTNYFIVSLAVADLMLAVLVLPLFVYSEVRSAKNTPRHLSEGTGEMLFYFKCLLNSLGQSSWGPSDQFRSRTELEVYGLQSPDAGCNGLQHFPLRPV